MEGFALAIVGDVLEQAQRADFLEYVASESLDLADSMGPLRASKEFEFALHNIAVVVAHVGPVSEEVELNDVDVQLL